MSTPRLAVLLTCAVLFFALAGCDAFFDQESFRVVRYSGPALSSDQSELSWVAEIEGHDVRLRTTLDKHAWEGNSAALVVDLRHISGALPRITSIWTGPAGGGYGKRIREATFEVETWEVDRLLSGTIMMTMPSGGRMRVIVWIDRIENLPTSSNEWTLRGKPRILMADVNLQLASR